MVKLGILAFANDSGLGNQTRRLVQMLKPYRIMLINATFSKNKQFRKDWYDGFNGYVVSGFPNNYEIRVFLRGLTHVLCAENPLNFFLLEQARRSGIKSYIQSNYEFCDNLSDDSLPLPDYFLMPSYWHLDTMIAKYGDRVVYLPPPIDPNEFVVAREINMNRIGKVRFLHIVGTLAANDRNGTLDLLESLKYTKSDFELVIRSQHDLPREYISNDKRIKYIVENASSCEDMYKDFDALILPRRYGGLSLTTNEALMSGLPVIMPDISPNNELLGRYPFLVMARKKGEFITRTKIDIYETNRIALAEKLDWLCSQPRDRLNKMKVDAFELGYENFSVNKLKPEYDKWLQ